jgi:hypothetical protein
MAQLLEPAKKAVEFAKSCKLMRRDPEAQKDWEDVYAKLSAPIPGLLGAAISRAEPHVIRQAMNFAQLDCSESIRRPHLHAALAVWAYSDHRPSSSSETHWVIPLPTSFWIFCGKARWE